MAEEEENIENYNFDKHSILTRFSKLSRLSKKTYVDTLKEQKFSQEYLENYYNQCIGAENLYDILFCVFIIFSATTTYINLGCLQLFEFKPTIDYHTTSNPKEIFYDKEFDYEYCDKAKYTIIDKHFYDFSLISHFNIYCDRFEVGLLGALADFGMMFGSLVVNFIGNIFKRKKGTIIFLILYIINLVSFIFATSKYHLFIYITLSGFFGIASTILLAIIFAETAGPILRDFSAIVFSLGFAAAGIVWGVFLINVSDYKIVLWANAAATILCLFLMVFVVDSPRYSYVTRNLRDFKDECYRISKINGKEDRLSRAFSEDYYKFLLKYLKLIEEIKEVIDKNNFKNVVADNQSSRSEFHEKLLAIEEIVADPRRLQREIENTVKKEEALRAKSFENSFDEAQEQDKNNPFLETRKISDLNDNASVFTMRIEDNSLVQTQDNINQNKSDLKDTLIENEKDKESSKSKTTSQVEFYFNDDEKVINLRKFFYINFIEEKIVSILEENKKEVDPSQLTEKQKKIKMKKDLDNMNPGKKLVVYCWLLIKYDSTRAAYLILNLVFFSILGISEAFTIFVKDLKGGLYFLTVVNSSISCCGDLSSPFLANIKALGRKGSMKLLFLLIAGLSFFLAFVELEEDVFSYVGLSLKVLYSTGYTLLAIYSLEYWPTKIRTTGFGTNSMFGRFGGFLFILAMEQITKKWFFIIAGSSSFLCLILAFFLEETLGRGVQDEIKEENIIEN